MAQMSEYDFYTPQRQSLVAILLVIYKTTKVIFRNAVVPIILFSFLGRKSGSSYSTNFIVIICGMSVISMIYSILVYYRNYFYIKGNELFVTKGLLEKRQVSIPLERIQSINFEQNLIHRIFNVKRINIDTAGSDKKEFELNAVKSDIANALRDFLMSEKKGISAVSSNVTYVSQGVEEKILNLSTYDLIKAGLFENHLRSLGLIFIFGWWIYTNLQEIGIDAEDYVDGVSPYSYGITIFISLLLLFFFFSVFISLISTILKFYNLKFTRINQGFKITQGLFNTKMVSALDHKIQSLSWSDNLLKKIIGIFDLKLKQASNKQVATKESIVVPGCSIRHVDQVIHYLYPNENIARIELKKVHKTYLVRNMIFSLILPLLFFLIWILFNSKFSLFFGVACLLFLPVISWLSYHKLAYGFNDDMIRLKGGAFGDKNMISPIYKIQAMTKKQNPFQRRNGLASLVLYNASGYEVIPQIPEIEVDHIIDIFLKKVETDTRKWM